MGYKWLESDTVIFLEYYRNYECLWNIKSMEYKDRNKRNVAYELLREDIMSVAEMTVDDIKMKIKNIRTTYGVELNKINKSIKSGAGSDDLYKPKLFWFEQADSFLRGVTRDPRNSSTNMDDAIMQQAEVVYCEDSKQNLIPSTSSPPVKRARTNIGAVTKALTQPSDITKANKEDEFDLFGKTIALQLKKMPLDIAIHLQEKIQSSINQERLKLFHGNTTSSPAWSNLSVSSPQTSRNLYYSDR